ncbi:MAG: hypothetical protein ACRYFX_05965 [Janthinobacterium lividum]
MKLLLLLAGWLLCVSAASAKPDPRAAQIHALHQKILAKQKTLDAQTANPLFVAAGGTKDAKRIYTNILQESKQVLVTLDQLSPAKSGDATQVTLVGELLDKETGLYDQATAVISQNQDYIERLRKSQPTKAKTP